MRTSRILSPKNINQEIKKLRIGVAKLKLDSMKIDEEIAQRQERLLALEELKAELEADKAEFLGFDRVNKPIREGDYIKLLTPSKRGTSFYKTNKGIVQQKSRRHSSRITIQKINGSPDDTTTRLPKNVKVTTVHNVDDSGDF